MQDRVDIQVAECLDGIADAGCDLVVALEPSEHEGEGGSAHRHDDAGIGVALHVAAADQPRDRHHGVGDAADRIGEPEIVDPPVARVVARMDVDHGAGFVRRCPERIEVGMVEHAADAARQGADHRARRAGRNRGLEHRGGARAVLQRHGRERHEARLGLVSAASRASLIRRLQASPSAAGSS